MRALSIAIAGAVLIWAGAELDAAKIPLGIILELCGIAVLLSSLPMMVIGKPQD